MGSFVRRQKSKRSRRGATGLAVSRARAAPQAGYAISRKPFTLQGHYTPDTLSSSLVCLEGADITGRPLRARYATLIGSRAIAASHAVEGGAAGE